MMDPVIFDSASPWSNLWLVSSALYVLVWAVFIAASLFVAAAVPYVVVRAVAGPRPSGRRFGSARVLVVAAVLVTVLTGAGVVGLAYFVGELLS